MMCPACGCLSGEGGCAECRELALEMAANAETFAALRDEDFPGERIQVVPQRRWPMWIAAAAMLAAAIVAVPRIPRNPPPAEQAPEELTVKMLTPDPTVVIYWLADVKKEEKR